MTSPAIILRPFQVRSMIKRHIAHLRRKHHFIGNILRDSAPPSRHRQRKQKHPDSSHMTRLSQMRGHLYIPRDPRLKPVVWRDLVPVTPFETIAELLLPASWLAASLIATAFGWYPMALLLSFIFFLTGLRIVHNAFHGALGLPSRWNNAVLWAMSVIMLGSLHAVRFNHLRHHRLALGEGDVEGRSAAMPAWRAVLFGPVFTLLLHVTALRLGNRRLRLTVCAQLLLNAVLIAWIFGYSESRVLRYQIIAMSAAHCLTAFFAVWTVHHHCDRAHFIARTLRNRLKNAITFDMFRHIEHHLFPTVPTRHLAQLSDRLDLVAPDLKRNIVF
jgi:fatty acid desaturase